MKHPTLVLFMLIPVLLSCGMPGRRMPASTLPAKTSDACVSPQPTQEDIDRVLSHAGGEIDPSEWERSFFVSEYRVAVTWSNTPLGAIIYLEALIFPCGYEETDLENYFNDENWKTIFLDYESHDLTAQCRAGNRLWLYQFTAANQGFDYNVHYWVERDTDTRVITTMLVFPLGSESLLDEYAARLFPDLATCS